jgi:gliding motility-associated-like protein
MLPVLSYGTHNRAGEITYEQIGDLTIRATITTYTKASSIQADRDTLIIAWGDGTSQNIGRINGGGAGEILPNADDMKINIYVAEHTYPGRATYTISMTDPNRIAGIRNVNFPNSVIVPFYIETTFTFFNPQFQGYNNSVQLLQPPIDNGCVGQRFIHNPNAFDIDGDSVAYALIVPQQARDSAVPRYEYPDRIEPGPNNMISLDETTGDFVWDAPQLEGDYNIAILIKEYRNGILINSIVRDMQITIVDDCDNRPPVIDAPDEICVIAGDTIEIPITVDDPDPSPPGLVRLTALGGPFEVQVSPAELDVSEGYRLAPLNGTFIWETACDHVSNEFYSVVFKGEDNIFDSIGLVDLKTFRIKITGPPPEDLLATSNTEFITLSWESPYTCEVTETDYFKGFTIWRKSGSTQVPLNECGVDLRNFGYTPIAFNRLDESGNRYFYQDMDVEQGITYCYRVTAEFALLSPGGNPFNRVQSLPSNEYCLQLRRDIPLITNVDVRSTDNNNGNIRVAWSNPLPDDVDTLENPGPYRLILEQAIGLDGTDFIPVPGGTFISNSFAGLSGDTSVLVNSLNTASIPYNYRVGFYKQNDLLHGNSSPASSVFLSVVSSDKKNILEWDFNVPWINFKTDIFRFNNSNGQFELIGDTESGSFEDNGLIDGQEYCYVVRTHGTYGISDIKTPLLNFSQEICGTPLDTLPPCSPLLTVENICDSEGQAEPPETFENTLSWDPNPEGCDNPDDAFEYQIFFSRDTSEGYTLLDVVEDPDILQYDHDVGDNLEACYFIVALDSVGNESDPSNIFCTFNCPVYELPNVFTPNNDGANDIFLPFPYRFVERVDFKVFNRWGNLVFETEDPDLNWDGTNTGGNELSEGTYYYTCDVFNRTVSGEIVEIQLSGYIELIR